MQESQRVVVGKKRARSEEWGSSSSDAESPQKSGEISQMNFGEPVPLTFGAGKPTKMSVQQFGSSTVVIGRARKHPKSLWKDEAMRPRELNPTRDGDIFKVIMPWLEEKKEEEANKPKKLKAATKGHLDAEDELRYLSKVIKVGAVEEFGFQFADTDFTSGQPR